MAKKFKTLHAEEETVERLKYMAQAQNKTISGLLKEIVSHLFEASSNIKEGFMVSDSSHLLQKCVFVFRANKTFNVSGMFSEDIETKDEETDARIKKEAEKLLNAQREEEDEENE